MTRPSYPYDLKVYSLWADCLASALVFLGSLEFYLSYEPNPVVVIHDLPRDHFTCIGIIMVKYAYLEQLLIRTLWDVMGISQIIGDIATSTPRITELILKIENICEINNIELNKQEFRDFRLKCDEIKETRDLLAHGAWVVTDRDKKLAIIKARGKWNEQQIKKHSSPSRFKAEIPEARIMSIDILREFVNATQYLIEECQRLTGPLRKDTWQNIQI